MDTQLGNEILLHLVLFNKTVTCPKDAALKDTSGRNRYVEMKFQWLQAKTLPVNQGLCGSACQGV